MNLNRTINTLNEIAQFNRQPKTFKHNFRKYLFLALTIANVASYGATNATSPQQALDDDYQKVTTLAYRELANSSSYKLPQPDLSTLISEVARADKANNSERVIVLVAANMDSIQKNINAKELQSLTEVVLKYHAIGVATDILNLTNQLGDRYSQAKQIFEFAKYEAAQSHWDKTIDWLKKVDAANELSRQDGDEAYIMYGAALQYKKKHREAAAYYAHIKSDSTLYPTAQLNTALVYIRQDWWTDAQLSIEQALNAAGKNDAELVNRLYTILGFSQLQQGFYRNARESFRNVKIKSVYANRALLGVGMAALNQEDFVGAINAFSQLKSHPDNDMSVAQAYLLNAYSLTKIKQNTAASSSYSEAISYYEQKTNYYDNLCSEINSLLVEIKNVSPASQTLLMNKINTDIDKDEPELSLLFAELNTLNLLNSRALSANALLQINKLYGNILLAYFTKASDVMTKKQVAFNSYLNQSRFGLTRLYDANN